ncbi:hypothetical protein AWB76_00929 [Caballeronia temeraria]|uniref:Uncharacterized protein n=1 Tax=Caballeronia temeraria TaxID=1777137 RepID=A0A157ZLX6_9BURK|nr:hypothetical protein [Caballeronia temeraria]SAK46520.1 hypothetical protein AWB76_00929 [Caballeronia temeraria]
MKVKKLIELLHKVDPEAETQTEIYASIDLAMDRETLVLIARGEYSGAILLNAALLGFSNAVDKFQQHANETGKQRDNHPRAVFEQARAAYDQFCRDAGCKHSAFDLGYYHSLDQCHNCRKRGE